ncbi:MAG: CBS domain-containing protein [Gammaproteobacteria bacterium]|jgi:CBS domain-containing protein|nr:CBS domain-containing protein [Gammaproteobacteria bacterium]
MKLVKHLLDAKDRNVISISPDASVFEAIKLMADENIGSLIVMDDNGRLAGIVTERDYARKVIVKGRSSHDTRVAEIMSVDVMTAGSDDTVNSCMEIMTDKKVRHLPVVEDDRVVAMVSIGDLVQAIIADQREEIEHLEHYISG